MTDAGSQRLQIGGRERSRTASNLEPVSRGFGMQPFDKYSGKRAAPTAHVCFIRGARHPLVAGRTRHVDPLLSFHAKFLARGEETDGLLQPPRLGFLLLGGIDPSDVHAPV